MTQNKAKPTLSLSLSAKWRFQRNVGLPVTSEGIAPTITAVYETLGPANMISVAHYPKIGIGVVYDTE